MASLAELPKLIGFFSYSRNDDEGDDGAVLNLANRIYRELRSQLGRNDQNFKLWRDKDALAAGEHWKEKLKEAVSEAAFFIQLVTPSAVNSGFCRFEFESFLEREKELGRNDLVFPILYISVPDLEAATADDAVISIVKDRQFVDWRPIRHYDVNSREVKQTVEQFCSTVSRKLRLPWLSPEKRREAEARQAAEAERRRQQEAEIKQRADEEERRRKAEAEERRRDEEERRQQEAEDRRRLAEAEAQKRGQDDETRRLEKEAKLAAKEEQRRKRLEQEPQQSVKPWLLPLIGAGAASLPMVLLAARFVWYFDAGDYLYFFTVGMIHSLYGAAAGMLIRRFGLLKALAIPVIPALSLAFVVCFALFNISYTLLLWQYGVGFELPYMTPSGRLVFAAATVVVCFVLAVIFTWLAFWLHSLWARKQRLREAGLIP
jgi:TIR domain